MKMYNELFYENDLISQTKEEIKNTMIGSNVCIFYKLFLVYSYYKFDYFSILFLNFNVYLNSF